MRAKNQITMFLFDFGLSWAGLGPDLGRFGGACGRSGGGLGAIMCAKNQITILLFDFGLSWAGLGPDLGRFWGARGRSAGGLGP